MKRCEGICDSMSTTFDAEKREDSQCLPVEQQVVNVEVQTENQKCFDCNNLSKRNRKLKSYWLATKHKLRKMRLAQKECEDYHQNHSEAYPVNEQLGEHADIDIDSDLGNDSDDAESIYMTEEEEGMDVSQSDSVEDDAEDEEQKSVPRVNITDDVRKHPKFIVFLSQLLVLFKICSFCHERDPHLEVTQTGTMATIKSKCKNLECQKEFVWKSQPLMPGTKIAAGNFLLSFAILVAGSSASKVLHVLQHMGLACTSLSTYFRHQRKILFPSIYLHWKEYQQRLLNQAKDAGSLILAGDGRHDSMGHCAKYCAYTIFSCTTSAIIHFSIVQRNDAGSSPAIGYLAFKNCMTFLLACNLLLSTFISDRHGSISKHMREKLKNVKHYFDLWHLKKKITKVLTKVSKECGCEGLTQWIKPCGNNFYWSACSTHDGNGKVIWAKFKSFLGHIVNKHDNLDDPLFSTCAHGPDITPREYLLEDSVAYEKTCNKLTNTRLVNAIHQASPISQTSCLEGFHSVLNHFSPKMIHYSFPGMYCRHILATIHFNKNLRRDPRTKKDGSLQVKVVHPKFKNGEGTVRDVRVKPVFDYVDEIFKTVTSSIKQKKLKDAREELKQLTPPPMNQMLDKQPRAEAMKKRDDRQRMTVKDVPPSIPVTELQSSVAEPLERAKPRCSLCKNLMKGHKNIVDCPRNKK